MIGGVSSSLITNLEWTRLSGKVMKGGDISYLLSTVRVRGVLQDEWMTLMAWQ